MTWPPPRPLRLLAALALLACRAEDVVAVGEPTIVGTGGQTGGSGAGGGSSNGAGGTAGSAGQSSPQCTAGAPAVVLVGNEGVSTNVCTGQIAARTFTHAICACGDLSVPGDLFSAALDSGDPEASSKRGGAAVGINGNYARVGGISLDGSLKVAAADPITTAGSVRIGGDLWLAGPAAITGLLTVVRDAWLTQSVATIGVATVGRDLHTAPDATLTALGLARVLGTTTSEAWALEKPCACDAGQLLDIPGLVAAARASNDDASAGIQPEAFLLGSQSPTDLVLSCGRFYLRGLTRVGALRMRVTGRVALFVEGDVQARDAFSIELGTGAELDWFISGNFTVDPAAHLGDPARPAAVRIYVQGEQEIELPGSAQSAFNLYAPLAAVSVAGTGDVYGSVFAREIRSDRDALLHYDRAVLRAGLACEGAASGCQACAQCNAGPECLANACFTCAVDADCCAPFACLSGMCRPLIAN